MVGFGALATCSGRSARVEMVGQVCSGSADLQVRVQHLVLALPSRLQPATAFSSTCLISSARESRHIFFKRAALGSQQNLRIRYNGKAPRFRRFHNKSSHGEMAEWLKAHAWKACVLERVPRVRIPVSPPFTFQKLRESLVPTKSLRSGAIWMPTFDDHPGHLELIFVCHFRVACFAGIIMVQTTLLS
jgi:hypothetical protein